jgi:hypothetical protein
MSHPFGQVGHKRVGFEGEVWMWLRAESSQPHPHSLEVLVFSCYPQNLGQFMFPGIDGY